MYSPFASFIVVDSSAQTLSHVSLSSSSEISMDNEKMHIPIWTLSMASSMQAALHMDPYYAKNLEIFKNSEFENIESLFQCYEHDDCRKFRIKEFIPSQIPRIHRGRDPHCLMIKQ